MLVREPRHARRLRRLLLITGLVAGSASARSVAQEDPPEHTADGRSEDAPPPPLEVEGAGEVEPGGFDDEAEDFEGGGFGDDALEGAGFEGGGFGDESFGGGFEEDGFDGEDDGALTGLSMDDLMGISLEVTSAAKKPQSVARTPAAITVLTAEDVRRSGATSIMEALRMVPGMHVARINGPEYAISSRGFANRFANKMLVLIDGRSVYNRLFSGTFWEAQDVVLEDLDRIEVIRGPGAALWGANAVNGVINIITRSSAETQGTLVSVLAGSEEQGAAVVRHGGAWGEHGSFRVYAKAFQRDALHDPGHGVEDRWSAGRAGLRADWSRDRDSFTFTGDVSQTTTRPPTMLASTTPPFSLAVDDPTVLRNAHALARWTRELDDAGSFSAQLFYNRSELDALWVGEHRDMVDFEAQHRFRPGRRHELVWGLGYRLETSNFDNGEVLRMNPDEETNTITNLFVQDDITLHEKLHLILGAKLEHDTRTHQLQFLPNARLTFSPNESHHFWASAARAVRTPAQSDQNTELLLGFVPDMGTGFDTRVTLFGDRDIDPEELLAFELGYRFGGSKKLYLDLTAFYNSYDDLVIEVPGAPFFTDPGTLVSPLFFANAERARTWGLELSGHYQCRPDLRLAASYSWLRADHHVSAVGGNEAARAAENGNPEHQASLRLYWDLAERWELDTSLYFVGRLPTMVPSYVRADVRLGFHPDDDTELSLGIQGLLHDDEPEFGSGILQVASEMEAGAYLKATLRF